MWDVCATKWPWLSRVPPVVDPYAPNRPHRSPIAHSWHVSSHLGTRRRPRGYRSGRVRGGAGPRASRRPRTGERAGAATRGRARQPRAHPRRRSGPRRRPPDHDGRDRRGGRRRALDALPPLRDPGGSVRGACAGGRARARTPRREPQPSGRLAPLPYQAPGRLGRAQPLALEVTHVLDEVPPHLIADQLVAEARRAAGVAVALYIVDIDGSQLIRLAGSEDFPETLEAPPALGPEIVPEGLPSFYELLKRRLPRCVATPLWLRGRVIGLLLCVGAPGRAAWRTSPSRAPPHSSSPTTTPTSSRPPAAQAHHGRRRGPVPPAPAARGARHRRADRRRAAARLRGRRRLVRLRREPRRVLAGDRGHGRHRPHRGRPGRLRPRRPARRPAQRPGPRAGRREHRRGRPRPGQPELRGHRRCSRAGMRRRRCSRGSTAVTRPPTWSMARAASPSSKAPSMPRSAPASGPPSFEVGVGQPRAR